MFTQNSLPRKWSHVEIALSEAIDKLPVAEIQPNIRKFVEPMTENLCDKRLLAVVCQSGQSILATETPVIATSPRSISQVEADCWATIKPIYRFLEIERLNHLERMRHLFALVLAAA